MTLAVPATLRPWLRPRYDALMLRAIPDAAPGHLVASPVLHELVAGAQAVLFGPGCGREPATGDALAAVLRTAQPLVLDADGLRLLATRPELLPRAVTETAAAPPVTVLTPHPGEMQALLDGFGLGALATATRAEQALALARHTGAVIVLKGAQTESTPAGRRPPGPGSRGPVRRPGRE